MSTTQSTVDFLLDQLAEIPSIRARKMFGEYALYADEKVVALVCDDQLYIKPTPGNDAFIPETSEAPPYPGAKNYLLVSEEYWENREWLTAFIRHTSNALPAPKPKPQRRAGLK